MDQPCSGKTEISRNCGVRERKHAAVVELQMSWVSDTRFPQPEKRAESISSPWGMNPSPPLPHSGFPHTSPAAHRGHNPQWCPPSEKGAHPHTYLGMGPGKGNQQHQHWSFTACFISIILNWSQKVSENYFAWAIWASPAASHWAQGDGDVPRCFTPASHKASSSQGTTIQIWRNPGNAELSLSWAPAPTLRQGQVVSEQIPACWLQTNQLLTPMLLPSAEPWK